MKLPLRLLCLFALPAVVGCPSEEEPPLPPEEDGVLACGGTESLDGLTTGDSIRVSAEVGTALLFEVDVGASDGHGLRLRAESSNEWRRVTEIWDGQGDRRLIPATAEPGEDLFLEVLVPAGATLSGSVVLTCADVPEVCFDLNDNDGNGATDCADLACARDADCAEDQEAFQEVEPECSDDYDDVDLDTLDRLSDQRTLYTTRPAGDGAPWQSFWGGGEVVVLPPTDPGSVAVRVGGAGMLCLGPIDGEAVDCSELQTVSDGDEFTFQPGELPAYFEPDGPGWDSFEIRLDCETE